MTTFGAYLWGSGLPGDRSYALAIPELSYPTYKSDLTDAKDFYLYSVDVADAKINGTPDAWTDSKAEPDDLYLLPAALSYLAAAAKEGGHVIIDVAVPGWNSIAYESLPFLYINNDKMMLEQRKSSRRIQLVVGGEEPAACDLSLDLRSGDSAIGKSGVFRITESAAIRDYAFLQPTFVHRIQVQRGFVENIDRIFVADVFANIRRFGKIFADRSFPDPASATHQVLAALAGEWDLGHKDRGFNIAAALGVKGDAGIELAALVLNEKKRSRIAHAETRLVSFMNVVCSKAEWAVDSPVAVYIAGLAGLDPEDVVGMRRRFLIDEQSAARLVFFSSFQPCYMCRAEPDGALIGRITAVDGIAIAPDGRSLRSSFGGTYLSRMERLYYYDMDSNIFYPRLVVDAVAGEEGQGNMLALAQIPAKGFVSPQGQPVFGPVAIGNAKEDYATDTARKRITNSSYLPVADDASLSFKPDEQVDYGELQPGPKQPIGMRTTVAPASLSDAGLKTAALAAVPQAIPPAGSVGVVPSDAAPATPADASPAPDGGAQPTSGQPRAPGLSADQIRALQRAAVLLSTLGRS
ncbi:MAG: hypothetical protein JF625_04825 [Inquilinus limosus]|uniref:Uncharacterized protein n=1 Tax=Inquilinus limosus TaxID=171674 RepID=A0A952FGJ2_9PROT|nr:hypothetical protein [Inquilinus limosus]